MKLKTLSVAVALAASTQVSALPVESININSTLSLYISGATAADRQVASYIDLMCADDVHSYITEGEKEATAYVCTLDSSQVVGINQDQPVIFYKNSGGSSRGVAPVANQTQVAQTDLSKCTTAVGVLDNDCGGAENQVDRDTMVGISDVEPELFTIDANGGKAIAAGLSVFPMNASTFGVVATPEMRDALQAAQGLTVGSDEVADMPSLSAATVANIFTSGGPITSWNQLKGQDGEGIVASYNAANGTSFLDGVALCVRKPGSGTQAQFNAFYMKNACAYRGASDFGFLGKTLADRSTDAINDYNPPRVAPFPGAPLKPAPWVFGNNGSSDMGKCMNATALNNNMMALGFQSLEKTGEDRTDRNRFKFIAIDGVAPTLENVSAGLYNNWASATIQWRADVVQAGTPELALAERLRDLTQNYADVASANANLKAPNANSPQFYINGDAANVGSLAFAAAANNATPPSAGVTAIPFNATYPVVEFSKGLDNGSNCGIATFGEDASVNVSVK